MLDLARTDLVILDDWGLAIMTTQQRHDLLEILEDRNGLKSTIVTSQLPIESWHEYIGDPTLADAILDRLVHSDKQPNTSGSASVIHSTHCFSDNDGRIRSVAMFSFTCQLLFRI
jgi:DNA replication protein DnaC